jgi:hypothetical protein
MTSPTPSTLEPDPRLSAVDGFARKFGYDEIEWFRDFLWHLRESLDPRNYDSIARKIETFFSERLPLAAPDTGPEADRAARDITNLKQLGYCRLGRMLDDDQLAEIHAHFAEKAMTDAWELVPGHFMRDEVPDAVQIGEFAPADIVPAPHLFALANSPRVLARVAGFLGVPPTIQYLAAWWSFAGRRETKGPQVFHVDRACYRFLKLFVYLTDVDVESGPHVYVTGSSDPNEWAQRLKQKGDEGPAVRARFDRMFQSTRKSDSDVADFFGADRVRAFVGKAGDAFLINTAGFHKGLLPKSRDRLIFQSLYTMLPTIKHPVDPVPLPGFFRSCMDQFGTSIDERYLRYVSRLVVDDPI